MKPKPARDDCVVQMKRANTRQHQRLHWRLHKCLKRGNFFAAPSVLATPQGDEVICTSRVNRLYDEINRHFTVCACVSTRRTRTVVSVRAVGTISAVLAWSAGTVIDRRLAKRARIPDLTVTDKRECVFNTRGAVLARIAGARSAGQLTLSSIKGVRTRTVIPIHQIRARTTILTGCACALVDVGRTVDTGIPTPTRTMKRVNQIGTRSAVFTRVRCAFVDIGLTEQTAKSSDTRTAIQVDGICTGSAVQTWNRTTLVDIGLTRRTAESGSACTHKRIDPVGARPAVGTRIGAALVNVGLTIDS